MISRLRELFTEDPDNTYYITGAPQCPIPEPNSEQCHSHIYSFSDLTDVLDTVGVIIENAEFDYLWPQFYSELLMAPYVQWCRRVQLAPDQLTLATIPLPLPQLTTRP